MTSRRVGNDLIRAAAVWSALTIGTIASGGDWPNFRGPNHDGISDETQFKAEWKTPLKLVWERNVGSGFSSFAIVAGTAYTAGTQDRQQTLLALNADTGEVRWSLPFEREYREAQGGDGPRATPTVANGRVYMLGARGRLICVDAATGKIAWEKQFGQMPTWGYSGSVLIDGPLAVVSAGNTDGALIAFDKATGSEVWKAGDQPVGYATPYPFTFNGQRYIVGFMGDSAIIVRADSGEVVWTMKWKTDWDVNAAAPIFHDGHLFFSSGYGHGSVLVKLRADGAKLASDTVWESKVLLNQFQSSVLYNGHLYTSDDKGLKCVEFLTGQQTWERRRIDDGTTLIANGHLFVLTEAGELMIAKAEPGKFEPLTEANILSGRCWTVPVLYNGRIYARDLERLVCFSLND